MINPALLLAKTKKVAITRKWEAATEIDPIALELPGYYCDMLLKFSLVLDTGSTVSPATDWDAKIVQDLVVKPTNLKPFLELDDARQLKYENFLRAHGALYIPDLPAENLEDQPVAWQYHIHPGDSFLDRYDISDIIATRGLSNLSFSMRWGSDSDLGTGYIIKSGKVELVISYAVLQPGITELRTFPGMPALAGRVAIPSFWQPQWRVVRFPEIKAEYKSLTYEKDFLNGFFLREVLMMFLDKTNAFRDDLVTQLQITDKEGYEYFIKDLTELELENMEDFELTSPLVGIAWIDLKKVFQKTRAGLYIAKAEDLKWHFTINASETDPATIVLVHRTHFRTGARADVVGQRPAEFVV